MAVARIARRRVAARSLAISLVIATILAAVLLPPGPADAQGSSSPTQDLDIDVISASPWVEPDGEWTAQLRIAGAAPGSTLTYTVRQAITGTELASRTTFTDEVGGTSRTRALSRAVTSPVSELAAADGTTTLSVPVRAEATGEEGKVYIPTSGVYPVTVTVTSPDRPEPERTTLFLNRLPTDVRTRTPMKLSLVVDVDADLAFGPDGAPAVTPGIRTSLVKVTELLDDTSGLQVSAGLDPQALAALVANADPADDDLLGELQRRLGDTTSLASPWTDVHLEAWARTGRVSDLRWSLQDGRNAIESIAAGETDERSWIIDDTVGSAAVDLLAKLGVRTVVVPPGLLDERGETPLDESGFSRPFRLIGSSTSLLGVATDPEIDRLLSAPSDNPTVTAQQIAALLITTWLADDEARGSVVVIDETTNRSVLQRFAELLRDPLNPVKLVAPSGLDDLEPLVVGRPGREQPWSRQLIGPSEVPDVAPVATALAAAEPLWRDLASMLPDDDEQSLATAAVIQRSLDRSTDPTTEAGRVLEEIVALNEALDSITASKPRSLTVTSRQASIPLRFTNSLDRPLAVRLRLQSPRLDFEGGSEQALVLEPGLNRIDVAVQVRASGQFTLQADIVAPESNRVLATTRQRIRSTTFSGVGLILSGGALLFLVFWWSRTLRRSATPTPVTPDGPTETD